VFDNLGQDAVFTLDQLEAVNSADPNQLLTGRLDLHHVGIFGTSLGGITAAEACHLDRRFGACLMVDVAMPPDIVRSGVQQSTMWISAEADAKRLEGWTTSAIDEQQTTVAAVFASLPGDGYLVSIPGMFHGDIADLPFAIASPLGTWLGTTGPTDWRRSHAILNAYSLAFFDRYVQGKPEPLLDGPSAEFPEVRFEQRP
jgi:Platelet-activating factor acetylhydrolase, isoform II